MIPNKENDEDALSDLCLAALKGIKDVLDPIFERAVEAYKAKRG